MAQFSTTATGKNPPWARSAEMMAVSAGTTMTGNTLAQAQVQVQAAAGNLLAQPGVAQQAMFNMGNASQTLQSQINAQQLAVLQQQQAAMAATAATAAFQQSAQASVLTQPGIAIPTTLASSQVATVSYPAPKAQQNQGPKQRVFTGTVTKLHDNFGFVDEDVFFQTACVKGVMPRVGDRVLVEATYNANMPFKWNATRVQVLHGQGSTQSNTTAPGNLKLGGIQANQSISMGAPQPLMQQNTQPTMGLLPGSGPSMRGSGPRRESRFEKDRDRKREDRERREKNRRSPPVRKRSRSPKKSSSPVQRPRSPLRRRARVIPRYVVQIPKVSFDLKESTVVALRARYGNMYIPSDFFNSSLTWTDCFPLTRPFKLGHHCSFHVLHRDIEPVTANDAILDPPDADHLYGAKVMLLASPTLDDLYHKSAGLSEDPESVRDNFVHPTRLVQFLVGVKGKNEPIAIGGAWSPSLDGPNPAEDPRVLINTAVRTTKALTGVDLSACTSWYRFAEVRYLRPEEMHKGKLVPARVETSVIFLPDVWSCQPTRLEWETLQAAYKKQLNKKLAQVGKDGDDTQEEDEDGEGQMDGKSDPTHFSELDPKTMKIVDLRRELECRNLSSKGLKSQLIARLTKALKTEQEKEAAEEAMETQAEAKEEEPVEETEEKDEDKKKEEEEKRRKEEKERAILERRYTLPDSPSIIVHPNPKAKSGKFDCSVMSLSVLLDYRPEDNKEHSFEVSLFAEMFNEMLMRDFGFEIHKAICRAPEKPQEEKKDQDKDKKDKDKDKDKDKSKKRDDKKDDKKDDEPSSAKKKKVDEKDKKDDRKAYVVTETGDKKKDEKKSEENGTESMETEEKEDKRSKDKDKEKERKKKKYVTIDPFLLLAFTYFDQNHVGYLLDRDVEDIIHTIGFQLSRAQVKKLVQKVVSRDSLHYRKLTDKLAPGQQEEEKSEEKKELVIDVEKIAAGNLELRRGTQSPPKTSDSPGNPTSRSKKPTGGAGEGAKSGLINYNGAIVDIESIMQRVEKSEKASEELERKMKLLTEERDIAKKDLQKKEDAYNKVTGELKTAQHQLTVQAKLTDNSESSNRRYLSALMQSKTLLNTLITTVGEALGDNKPDISAIKKEEPDVKDS